MQTRLVVHENLRAGSDEHTTPNLHAAGNVRPRIDNAAFADPHFVTQRATEVAQRESIENNVHSANHSGTDQRAVSDSRGLKTHVWNQDW